MNKYIDSEKLKTEIERRRKFHDDAIIKFCNNRTIALTHSAGLKEDEEIVELIDSLQQEQSIQVNTLTWKDINDLERIINNVHYEFRNGIGEKSFGEEVLERFREENDLITDIRSPKFNIGDKICSKDGQYHDEVVSVNFDGSYKLKILGELFLPEEEWKLEYERNDGFELIERNAKKQPGVDLEKEIDNYLDTIQAWQIQEAPFTTMEKCARYFYELGQQEMRRRITNSEYNVKVVERLKSEYPITKEEKNESKIQ